MGVLRFIEHVRAPQKSLSALDGEYGKKFAINPLTRTQRMANFSLRHSAAMFIANRAQAALRVNAKRFLEPANRFDTHLLADERS